MTIHGISVIATAARPENWESLYESIGTNDIPFEVVFVGPNAPKHPLPENFRFIKSNTKPAQAAEIACRNAIYPLVMIFADDVRFRTEQPLDKAYQTYVESGAGNTLVSCRYQADGEARTQNDHRFIVGDPTTPVLPLCTLMSTSLWRDIGGVDKNFIAVCWDLDIAMRVMAAGGKVVFSDVLIEEDSSWSRGSTLDRDYRSTDHVLRFQLWSTEGKVHFNRSQPVESFSDEDILTRSQGPMGRWHHNSDLMNGLITSRGYYALKTWNSSIRGRINRFKLRNVSRYIRRMVK